MKEGNYLSGLDKVIGELTERPGITALDLVDPSEELKQELRDRSINVESDAWKKSLALYLVFFA